MRLNGNNVLALVLIAFGGLILLGKIGLGLGWMIHLLIPFALIALGYIGFKNGRKVIGSIIMFIGLISLLGSMSGIIGILIAVAIVVYGISLLKGNHSNVG